MRFLFAAILVFSGSFLFSKEIGNLSIDTNYTLYDLNKEETVDPGVQFVITKEEPQKFVNRPVSGGNYQIGSNYASTQNVDPKVAIFISVSFVLFVLFVIFRVRRSLKKDKTSE